MRILSLLILASFSFLALDAAAQETHKSQPYPEIGKSSSDHANALMSAGSAAATCEEGMAGEFPCNNVDLLAHVGFDFLYADLLSSTNGVRANDLWGWTDPDTGTEYVLTGLRTGTAFVDISDPVNPVNVAVLPSSSSAASDWRDIKVYANHAFIVSEAPNHGMQVFDLTQLRGFTSGETVLVEETALYDGVTSAHNLEINTETGYAYIVGSKGTTSCGGGLHMVNIQEPALPTFEGCFSDQTTGRVGTGYSHAARCVIYNGPDTEHVGKEICIGQNETDISIADVTDKSNPIALSTGTYPTSNYIHQGWFTDDQRYFFQNDELDELNRRTNTKMIIWDLEDLDDPIIHNEWLSNRGNIDHDLYIHNGYLYQSNYTAGLIIMDIKDPANPVEVGQFDVHPVNNNPSFLGSWGNYPFFESGTIAVSSLDGGLFLVKFNQEATNIDVERPETAFAIQAPYPNPVQGDATFGLTLAESQHVDVAVFDMLGREMLTLNSAVLTAGATHRFSIETHTWPAGTYVIRATSGGQTRVQLISVVK